jgi:hypothetical protein
VPQITSRLHRLMTRNRSRSAASRREASESCHCRCLCLRLTPLMRMTRFPSFLQPAASLMSRIAFNARWRKGAYIPPLHHDPLYHSTPPVPAAPTLTSSCSRRHSAILVYLNIIYINFFSFDKNFLHFSISPLSPLSPLFLTINFSTFILERSPFRNHISERNKQRLERSLCFPMKGHELAAPQLARHLPITCN